MHADARGNSEVTMMGETWYEYQMKWAISQCFVVFDVVLIVFDIAFILRTFILFGNFHFFQRIRDLTWCPLNKSNSHLIGRVFQQKQFFEASILTSAIQRRVNRIGLLSKNPQTSSKLPYWNGDATTIRTTASFYLNTIIRHKKQNIFINITHCKLSIAKDRRTCGTFIFFGVFVIKLDALWTNEILTYLDACSSKSNFLKPVINISYVLNEKSANAIKTTILERRSDNYQNRRLPLPEYNNQTLETKTFIDITHCELSIANDCRTSGTLIFFRVFVI